MTNEVTKEQREALSKAIYSTPGFRQTDYMADCIAERVIELGWTPPFSVDDIDLDHNKVVLTPDEEIEVVDRIISGLNIPIKGRQDFGLPELVKIDATSFVNDWTRIPTWDNYEINTSGAVRNRWTKRELDKETLQGDPNYVEMHDSQGFTHTVHIPYLMEQVFGE